MQEQALKQSPNAVKDLDRMIGLKSVKEEMKTQIAVAELRDAMRKRGLDVGDTSMNMVLEGEPGVGKSVAARKLGAALAEQGMLKKGEDGKPVFVEESPGTLKGEFEGQTAPKVIDAFKRAKGGILFIDEANAWANPDDSYGVEGMDTLMKLAEDNQDDVMVILGGYPGLRRALQQVNPGLPRRFPGMIEFPNYTTEEKVKIGRSMFADNSFKITPKVAKHYAKYIGMMEGQGGDVRSFNGFAERSVAIRHARARNKERFAYRIAPADIEYAAAHYRDKNGRTLEEAAAHGKRMVDQP